MTVGPPTDDLNENVNAQINVNEVTFNNGDDEESVINVDNAVTVNDMCDEFNESDPSSDSSNKDEHNIAASTLIAEQQQNKSLNVCRSLSQRGKAGYFLTMAFCTVMSVYLDKNMNSYVCLRLDELKQ